MRWKRRSPAETKAPKKTGETRRADRGPSVGSRETEETSGTLREMDYAAPEGTNDERDLGVAAPAFSVQ